MAKVDFWMIFVTVAVQYNVCLEISEDALLSVVSYVCCVQMHVTIFCVCV